MSRPSSAIVELFPRTWRVNPALPLLLALSALGLLWRRRETGVPWVVLGLTATTLLAPALALPDGLPSPSALLAEAAPWQALRTGRPSHPDLLDVPFKIEPWLLFNREELRHGRLPFWNPHQFAGSPHWGNGQSGPLHPFHLLFTALPLSIAWTLLAWVRLVAASLGAFLFARELKLGREPALLAALVYAFAGRTVAFLLFPMANALAAVPWVFLATERLLGGKPGVRLLAAAVALCLLSGHPETAVYLALAASLYWLLRRPRPWWPSAGRFTLGWALGGALAAVEALPVFRHLLETERWQAWQPPTPLAPGQIGAVLLRLLLPDAYGHLADGTYFGSLPFVPTTVFLGLTTVPLALAGLAGLRQDRRVQALLGIGLFALLGSFQVPGVAQVLNALPVVSRGLAHYLLPMGVLALAALAGIGLEHWLAGRSRPLAVGAVAVLVAAGLGGWALEGEWRTRGLLPEQLAWLGALTAVALGLVASARLAPARRRQLVPLCLLATAASLVAAHARSNPGLSQAQHFVRTPALTFLAAQDGRVTGLDQALRPNAATAVALYDVRGDDSAKLARFERIYAAELGAPHATDFQPIRNWSSPWLDRLAVRWVLAPPRAEAPVPGWRTTYRGQDATVFERPSALPLVRWAEPDPGATLRVETRLPGLWEITWTSARPARLVVAETWDPGWSAKLDGRPVPVERQDELLLAVPVPAGSGRLRLAYLPPGIGLGLALSLFGLGVWLSFARAAEPRPSLGGTLAGG
jgi:hypothetical protein